MLFFVENGCVQDDEFGVGLKRQFGIGLGFLAGRLPPRETRGDCEKCGVADEAREVGGGPGPRGPATRGQTPGLHFRRINHCKISHRSL